MRIKNKRVNELTVVSLYPRGVFLEQHQDKSLYRQQTDQYEMGSFHQIKKAR
jgi:hypothetical protein